MAALREQLEVARALGLVDVRPRVGTRRLPFSFTPAVRQSLSYALALDSGHFQEFSGLRNHLEAAYWDEALTGSPQEDKAELLRPDCAGPAQSWLATPPKCPTKNIAISTSSSTAVSATLL